VPTSTVQTFAPVRAVAVDPDWLWRVIQTRPRQEKALSRTLAAARIEHDPLLVRRQARHGGRRRWVETPLFPSYLVIRGPREHAFFAMETKRAARIIDVDDQRRFEAELEQIRTALSTGAEMDPFPHLARGVRARVSRGPLKGVEGIVEDRPSVDRLILEITALGRAVSLEIDPGLLERA
jgi:transcription antitermination factor NusG